MRSFEYSPIDSDELKYLDLTGDLIRIVPSSKGLLTLWCEKSRFLKWLFRKELRPGQIESTTIRLWSEKAMQASADAILITTGLCMLYGPMWWLNWVDNSSKRLGIITGFVFLFAMSIAIIGGGRPFETLGATAAYAAVLMVFMQVQHSGSRPGDKGAG
jgi:hypothetical protein